MRGLAGFRLWVTPARGVRRIGMDLAMLLRQPRMIAFTRLLISEAQRFPELTRMMMERGEMLYIARVGDYLKREILPGRRASFWQ